MTERKHTPLPWGIMRNQAACALVARTDGAKQAVRIVAHIDNEITAEDAAFICRAVNSHYELLEALKKCRAELVEELKELGRCDHSVGMCFCPIRYALEAADAAIAKATT